MTGPGLILVSTFALPILIVVACTSRRMRAKVLALLPLAPAPGLVAPFIARGDEVAVSPPELGFTLAMDDAGALLLGGASLLWCASALYARADMKNKPGAAAFSIWWLITLAGSSGVFIAADIVTFYLAFSLASLAAYGLVTHDKTERAHRAGLVYMVLALLGEAFILLALVMLASLTDVGNPLIRDAVMLLPKSPVQGAVIALLILGFGLKMGLVPLHVWMPLAHPVAPIPASAVLSGIIVKAGVIGLIRFLPLHAPASDWGAFLICIGLFTAFYGVLIGITQTKLKTVLAYSTVSQMGVVAALLGCGLAAGTNGISGLAAFYALHHILVKGALFIGLGIASALTAGHRSLMFALMAVLALSLSGLPLTSGAVAKFATKDLFGDGLLAWLATLSTLGSGLLMAHFLLLLRRETAGSPTSFLPASVVGAWAVVAGTTLIAPWLLLPTISQYTIADVLGPASIAATSWPVAAGVTAAIILHWSQLKLPAIPEGDIIVAFEKLVPAVSRIGRMFEWIDEQLRDWSIACLVMLAIAIAFGSTVYWPH